MDPEARSLICSNCKQVNAPDARYCQRCGEPVAPGLLRDLQAQYDTLKSLDAAIKSGSGALTLAQFREYVLTRYTEMRTPRASAHATPGAVREQMGAAAPVTVPLQASAQAAVNAPTVSHVPSAPVAAPTRPHGPVFSWRAFIADQAIAIMAYLGGFLLLIATLTFEVGGWRALPDQLKLMGVIIVYVIFGALGIGLRRVASLRTVSRVYLGVFALMTPLAALAVYLFALQKQGFSQLGMACVASAYAAIVYLALAARTRFATYAYLGWAAALAAVVAIPLWAQAADGWWLAAGTIAALGLLAPRQLGARRPEGVVAWLARPAMWFSAGVSILSGLGALGWSLGALASIPADGSGGLDSGPRLALAVTLCALTALALGWSWTLHTLGRPVRWEALSLIEWLAALYAALAAVAGAVALGAGDAGVTYTFAGVALAEGVAVVAARRYIARETGLRVGVQSLTIGLAVVGALFTISSSAPNYPLIVIYSVGLALGELYALSGTLKNVIPWGAVGGVFALALAYPLFQAITPPDLLNAIGDLLPNALWQAPSLYAALEIGLAVVGVALGLAAPHGSRARALRLPVYMTALGEALFGSLLLLGHSAHYVALILGLTGAVTLAVGRIERQPAPTGIPAAILGALGAIVFALGSSSALGVLVVAPLLALAGLVVYFAIGRAYALPVYVTAVMATLAAFLRLFAEPPATLPSVLAHPPLGAGGLVALVVATLLAIAAIRERSSRWQIAPAALAAISIFVANDLWPMVAITLAMVAVGALLRWRRGAGWGAAWESAAFVASLATISYALYHAHGGPWRALAIALLFTAVAWIVARVEQMSWLTFASAPYALVAFWQIGSTGVDARTILAMTIGLTLVTALAGALTRARLGRRWALALYTIAVAGSVFTIPRTTPYPEQAGLLEAVLLIYAAVAFAIALLEESPWAALAPALYASAAAVAQPDGRALLPLALGLAAAAFGVSRMRGARWALPLYGAAMVAAVASSWNGQAIPTFEPFALIVLALAAWLLAALESRAEAIIVAVVFATLAVPATAQALHWEAWAPDVAFAGLAWVVSLSGLAWARLPWLREREGGWLTGMARTPEAAAAWRDPHVAGRRVARVAALVIGGGAALIGALAPQAFATGQGQTQAAALTLLSLTGLLVFEGRSAGWRPALYVAGETAALVVTWELRWLGATNPQAWIIAPGSAQIIIGALLPADKRMRAPHWLPQVFSVSGALILTLPTLIQTVTEPSDWQWVYALVLAFESLVLALIAVGLRNRTLALTGSALVGVAAIRGAIIAVNQNLPVPLVIAVFAIALMGLATWLSLRSRHMLPGSTPEAPGSSPADGAPPAAEV